MEEDTPFVSMCLPAQAPPKSIKRCLPPNFFSDPFFSSSLLHLPPSSSPPPTQPSPSQPLSSHPPSSSSSHPLLPHPPLLTLLFSPSSSHLPLLIYLFSSTPSHPPFLASSSSPRPPVVFSSSSRGFCPHLFSPSHSITLFLFPSFLSHSPSSSSSPLSLLIYLSLPCLPSLILPSLILLFSSTSSPLPLLVFSSSFRSLLLPVFSPHPILLLSFSPIFLTFILPIIFSPQLLVLSSSSLLCRSPVLFPVSFPCVVLLCPPSNLYTDLLAIYLSTISSTLIPL